MLYRKIERDLKNWKDNYSTVLYLKGARQTGKTYSIREFGTRKFDHFYEINFTSNAAALDLLLEVKNYDDFIERITLLLSAKPGKNDLLFLDEIQFYYEERESRIEKDPGFASRYVDILTLSKEIADKGDFRLAMSGSLLGAKLFNTRLSPMGYVSEMTMYPLDFEEYLLAMGTSEETISLLKKRFEEREPVSDSINSLMLRKFKEYILVGGMPKAVDIFKTTRDFNAVEKVHDDIVSWYKDDIKKYVPVKDRITIGAVYESLPSELSKKNRKFVKTHLDIPGIKNKDLGEEYLWLYNAGTAIPVYNAQNPVFPLRATEDNKIMKLFANDVGLLTSSLFRGSDKAQIISDNPQVDLGAVYENAVAELLLCHGFQPYFASMKKEGEVDFLVERNLSVLPIEVKSGKSGRNGLYSHHALDIMLNKHPEIKEAYLFGQTDCTEENSRIKYYPVYMADFLRR